MASPSRKLFLIGPGFIGWNVLDLLVRDGTYEVTVFVRRREHGEQLKTQSGAAGYVLGDLGDSDVIAAQVAAHDVTIHTATADDLPSVEAVLEGVRRRTRAGKQTIFIHTSGTSVLDDGSQGAHRSDTVFYDNVPADLDGRVPDSAPHRRIDLAILRAQREFSGGQASTGTGGGGDVKLAIMIPPLIYGFNPAHGRLSIQIPTLTRFALKHGYVPHVGAGLGIESNIHVADLARAYVTLLQRLERDQQRTVSVGSNRRSSDTTADDDAVVPNPYYFCETTGDAEPSWREVAALIAEGLRAAGVQDVAPEPRTVPTELYGDLFGEDTAAVIGLNSRSRAVRLRELGWEPREKGWRESFLEDELPQILKETGRAHFKGYAGKVAS